MLSDLINPVIEYYQQNPEIFKLCLSVFICLELGVVAGYSMSRDISESFRKRYYYDFRRLED